MKRNRVWRILRTYPEAEALEAPVRRGELRLMAEALIARQRGESLHPLIEQKARGILEELAR